MTLDERGLTILTAVVNHPSITGNQLMEDFHLSRKQLSYSIEKINYYLQERGYAKITRSKTGTFEIPVEVLKSFQTERESLNNMIFTETERQMLSILILLYHQEELSVQHFVSALSVSKNTILKDLRTLESTILTDYDLKLHYSRQNGYTLIGKEYEKRTLLVHATRAILERMNGEAILHSILKIEQTSLKQIQQKVSQVEQLLQVNYTDVRIREIPYILSLIFQRIHIGKQLDMLPEGYQHIVGTNEYAVVMDVFKHSLPHNDYERLFLVSQFQASSSRQQTQIKRDDLALSKVVDEIIHHFESLTNRRFVDRKGLHDALIQHCKPAIYRLLYHYHIESNILNMILPQHAYLHEITRQSIAPLEKHIGQSISDEELAYVTILFGGWMTKEGTLYALEQREKALVVCTNGLSISNYLYINLKELFPELDFTQALSLREFKAYTLAYDLVFTTIYLETDRPQFLVRPIMDKAELDNLRTKVYTTLNMTSLPQVSVPHLMELIDRYADIKDERLLQNALKAYVDKGPVAFHLNHVGSNEQSLSSLLNEKTIQLSDQALDWQAAIRLASQPLLDHQVIEARYVQAMIDEVIEQAPFWNIAPNLVIAHAGIDQGVNRLGMSLLKLQEVVHFHENMAGNIIVVLATQDPKEHLGALYKLIGLTEDETLYQALQDSQSIEEIVELISREEQICLKP